MPDGKPAGLRCVQLRADESCAIFGDPRRPAVCAGLKAGVEMCGDSREQAMQFLIRLERATAPA